MDAILTLFALPRGRIGCGSRTASAHGQRESQSAVESEPCPLPSPPPLRKEGAGTWFSLHTRKNANLQRPVNTTLIPSLAQRGREGAATSFDPPRVSACLAQSATSDDHATLSN